VYKHFSLRKEEAYKGWLFLAPCLIIIAFVILYPLTYGIYLGFTNFTLGRASAKFTGLANYIKLFSRDRIFRQAIRNTVIWTVGALCLEYLIGLGAALLLNESFKGRWIFRGLILLPWVIPNVVGAYMWQWLYDPNYGLVNWFLMNVGLMPSKMALLGSPSTALYATMVVAVWRGIPFMTVMLLAGLQAIPRDLYEVAAIDGANMWQRFRSITFPFLRNITIVCSLLMTIWLFNHFDVPYVLTHGGPRNRTTLLAIYTYIRGLERYQMGYAASIGVFMLVVLLIFAIFYIKIVLKGRQR